MLYKLLSKLLDYPSDDLYAALPELRAALGQDLAERERQTLAAFLDGLATLEPTEAQARYVQTFDLTPSHSLHLTHHLFGEEKTRGPALIDLAEFYKEYGLELTPVAGSDVNELPDYLPLMLEFAGELDPDEARMFLAQWTRVLAQLANNLEAADSPYAPLVRLVEHHSRLIELAA